MCIEIRDNTLYFDGCDTTDLARTYGTPLYVYSQTALEDRFRALHTEFLDKWPNTRAAYAAKALCTPALLRLVRDAGLCVDVVSGGELTCALAAGFPPERIEFNGNNKLPAELELAVERGVGRIILDGLQELPLLESVCARKGKKMKVLYRVTPGVRADTHDYIITGKKDSKFGIPLDEDILYPAVQAAIDSPWVDLLGFHFHVGSQLFEVRPYLEALEVVLGLVGGGFGIRYTDEAPRGCGWYLDPIMARVEAFFRDLGLPRPAVVTEPGRSVVGEAGLTLYTVGSIKEIPGVRKYVAVDGGMTDNIRPALYQAKYRAIAANKAEEPCAETVTVCGKCCESGDILLRDAALPALEGGDLLAVLSTGAYGYAMASNYNSNPIPAVVLVKEGRSGLMVRRQTWEDLLATACDPAL